MNTPHIWIGKHRGKRAFIWKTNGKKQKRVIKDDEPEDNQKIKLLAELLAGKPARAPKPKSLIEHLDEWHQDLLAETEPDHANLVYGRVKRVFEVAEISKFDDITASKIRVTIAGLRCSVRNPKKSADEYEQLSERSRHHYARNCKQFTKWMVTEKRAGDDPLRAWGLKKVSTERHPRDRFQPDEIRKLIQTAAASTSIVEGYAGELRAWLYRFAVMTGFRRKELSSITPKTINLRGRTVTVAAGDTKNGEESTLCLHEAFAADLKSWLSGKPKDEPIFPGLAAKRTSKMIKRDVLAAGLPHKTDTGVRCFHSTKYPRQDSNLRPPV
jgi:integrase